MDEYEGHWQTTYIGKRLHYLDPQLEEIDILDIAHGLSLTCRFGGQCKEFFSVAQHSIWVARLVPPRHRFRGLLHDSREAYLTDMPRPIKYDMPGYREIEKGLLTVIFNKFVIYGEDGFDEVKRADDVMLATEARDNMQTTYQWAELPHPLPIKLVAMPSKIAEQVFLKRFEEYVNERNNQDTQ